MSVTDSIIGAESGGDSNAKNPNSSATGAGQFIDSTWLDMLAKNRPDLQGTPEQLLAMRSDPALSRQMTEAYAAQNGGILQKNGLPVTPGTTYLAHFAGPTGAVKVLQADPNAPVGSILGPEVMKANPFLAGMTAQGLQAWAAKKMGTPAPTAPSAPLSLAAPAAAPIFAPQPTAAPAAPAQPAQGGGGAPPDISAPPQGAIFVPPRKPVSLAGLKAALSRTPYFAPRG